MLISACAKTRFAEIHRKHPWKILPSGNTIVTETDETYLFYVVTLTMLIFADFLVY